MLAAAFIPIKLADRLEHKLAPWVAFLVVPLPGKQIGIFGAVRLAVRFGLAPPPHGATWLQVHGMAMLCGIGFTMSLFIGALAFPAEPAPVEQAEIGTLIGSFASALAGHALLRLAPPPGGREGPGASD